MSYNTTVIDVHVRSLRPDYDTLVEWLGDSPDHIYIGKTSVYVKGANTCMWSNPFDSSIFGHEESLEMYENHIRNNPELYKRLGSLRGKVLGDYIVPTLRSHGDVLLELIHEKFGNDSSPDEVSDLLEQLDALRVSNAMLKKAADTKVAKIDRSAINEAKSKFYHAMKKDKSITSIVEKGVAKGTKIQWQSYKAVTDKAFAELSASEKAKYA